MEVEQELLILRAERAISRVILSYARGVDRLDFALVRSCFHSDARIHYGDWFSGSLDEGITWLERSLPRLDGTLHVFGPPWIELDEGASSAQCETYSVNSALYPARAPAPTDQADGAIQNVSGTRYLDRFECRDGRWAITERRNQRVWSQNVLLTEDPPLPAERDRR
jgi:hypothetical protein